MERKSTAKFYRAFLKKFFKKWKFPASTIMLGLDKAFYKKKQSNPVANRAAK
ncbi:hypothetical protein [Bacillus sp. EB01]|uniref:hypothetical protein n=1 Tax=Bacillus sp. EB01 TaxID=1347086 RepID=UPI000ADB9387|nr:hypothetical protein [Bacillus sp. EB01]